MLTPGQFVHANQERGEWGDYLDAMLEIRMKTNLKKKPGQFVHANQEKGEWGDYLDVAWHIKIFQLQKHFEK